MNTKLVVIVIKEDHYREVDRIIISLEDLNKKYGKSVAWRRSVEEKKIVRYRLQPEVLNSLLVSEGHYTEYKVGPYQFGFKRDGAEYYYPYVKLITEKVADRLPEIPKTETELQFERLVRLTNLIFKV